MTDIPPPQRIIASEVAAEVKKRKEKHILTPQRYLVIMIVFTQEPKLV